MTCRRCLLGHILRDQESFANACGDQCGRIADAPLFPLLTQADIRGAWLNARKTSKSDQPALIARTSAARASTGIMGNSPWPSTGRTTEVIHNRLPFLDLLDSTLLCQCIDTFLIHRPGGSRSGVSLRGSSSASDLRLEGLTLLVFGHKHQFALCVFRHGMRCASRWLEVTPRAILIMRKAITSCVS